MKYKEFRVDVIAPHKTPAGWCPNRSLTEYTTKSQHEGYGSNERATYIAAQPGVPFSITVANESPHDASIVFYVDGQMASCLLCYARPKCNVVNCQGVQPQRGYLRRFVFSKAHFSEVKSTNPTGDEIGTIKVIVRRCVVLGYDAEGVFMPFNTKIPLDERTKKGQLDTRTELRPAETYRNGPFANVIYMDNATPWAEFTFIYKSYALLQAMGIVPQTPNHCAAPERLLVRKRGREETDDRVLEELKKLKLQVSRLQDRLTEPLESAVKYENESSSVKRIVKQEPHVIVDLTLD